MKIRRLSRYGHRIDSYASALILVLTFAVMLYLTGAAFFETTYISTVNEAGELAVIYEDNIFLSIIFSAIFMAALYLFYKNCAGISIVKIELMLLAWVFVLGAAFIVSVKLRAPWYSDAYYVTYAAQRAALGDYAQLGNYFMRFPFQLGYVLYSETFFRVMNLILPGLPEGYYCLALQMVNVCWLMLGYHALLRISMLVFLSRRIQKLTAVLLFFCLPPILSCTFLYGNMPAYCCGIVGVWMLLEYMKRRKLRYALWCTLAMSVAVILKLNLLIFCLAIAIVWLIDIVKHFSFKSALCLLLAAVCVLGLKSVPQRVYEQRCGKDFGSGIPMIAWMTMGFSEGYAGPGWYHGENTVYAFQANGNDPELTAEHAKQVIGQRLEKFAEKPSYALSFFSTKLRTQWNEPSYESIWVNEVQQSYSEKKGLYKVFCENGKNVTVSLMDQYQQLMFLGVSICLLEMWRRRDIRNCVLPLILLGGISYHLLFEAKSQYALMYYVLMIPMAGSGFGWLFYRIENRERLGEN